MGRNSNRKFKENVFRPDMMVFCDSVAEIPEIDCEILSPSSRQTDLRVKVVKYEEEDYYLSSLLRNNSSKGLLEPLAIPLTLQ